jgi:hypothetical protein
MGYAEDTKVPVEKSIREIEQLAERYGADQFFRGKSADPPRQFTAFRIKGQFFRVEIPMPTPSELKVTKGGQRRAGRALENALDKETRRRWRVLYLIIKALMEGVESGVFRETTEALQHFMQLPDGRTVGEALPEQLVEIYKTGTMRPLLPGPIGEKQ